MEKIAIKLSNSFTLLTVCHSLIVAFTHNHMPIPHVKALRFLGAAAFYIFSTRITRILRMASALKSDIYYLLSIHCYLLTVHC